jgi:N-acetylglucosaminyldiphosphoundecaprenol N-acetyl-beta-D-mannosaminyltransferase
VKVATFSPPFKDVFSKEDTDVMCQNVNACMPNVLFVGMTAPKQEIWVHNNKNRLNANLICSVGAVFDFYAGNIERAPTLMIKMGLEWLHRSLNSRRLLKRNFVSNPKFIMEVLKLKFK